MQRTHKVENRFLIFAILPTLFIISVSCNDGRFPGIPEFQEDISDITPGDISDSLIARIYFDATLSMHGFVVPGSTRYMQMSRHLESVIVSGWKDGKVDFFRFGEQIEPLDRGTYLRVVSTDFYENEEINRETFIQKIIDHQDQGVEKETKAVTDPEDSTEAVIPAEDVKESSAKDRLVVIVTDLFQDSSDINLLITQLKEKYIKNGLEVGLLGLRSEFAGTVYDTGPGEAPIRYRSDPNKPETFRPFYLLVLGRHADIAHYFNRLIASGFPEVQTIIFSQHLISPLLSFEGVSVKQRNLNTGNFISEPAPRLKQFTIVKNSEPADISAALEYTLEPHAMSFDSDRPEISIRAKHVIDGETVLSPHAQKCMTVTPTIEGSEFSNKLTITFSLASSALPRNRAVYLYEVTLSPRLDTYQAPEWCVDWDMGSERNGSKTVNLVNFVRDLSQVTARMHPPKIAQFHCYIEKR